MLLLAASSLQGQSALRVGADNDAFNFWLPPWDRPDREYTSGVRGALEYGGGLKVPLLGGLRRSVCGASESGCASHSFGIGQAIYTGDTQFPSASHRPNAGWLFVEVSERDSVGGVRQDISFAAGVVGPPALGEPMQKLFHALGPHYQRPIDWRRQLPFEPGFVARLSRTTTTREFDAWSWRGGLSSHFGGALGTILTSATAGRGVNVRRQLGGDAPRAWWPQIELGADVRGHLVVRDEFLDGTLFRSSESVGRRVFYDEERLSIGLRWSQVAVGFRATRTGKQYGGQPAPAEWSALELEWRR